MALWIKLLPDELVLIIRRSRASLPATLEPGLAVEEPTYPTAPATFLGPRDAAQPSRMLLVRGLSWRVAAVALGGTSLFVAGELIAGPSAERGRGGAVAP